MNKINLCYAIIPGLSTQCTLITQCSVDRLPQLEEQIKSWKSGISVAIYIPSSLKEKEESLQKVNELIIKLKNCFNYYVVISLLYGHECDSMKQFWDLMNPNLDPVTPLYPINNLRNLAVIASKSTINSPLLFLVDVDFIPSSNLSTWIDNSNSWMISKCDNGEVFVVPAFEREENYSNLNKNENGNKSENNPNEILLEGLECGFITPFHVSHFPAGHQPTNYSR